ncbi:hypothetical protein L2E82_50866 [Cichorium intybus]|nr:hypothetical protein L2E82_50866 [Cichorium intybus]
MCYDNDLFDFIKFLVLSFPVKVITWDKRLLRHQRMGIGIDDDGQYTTDSLSILVGTKEFGFSAYGLLGPPSCLLSFTFNLLFSLDLTEG